MNPDNKPKEEREKPWYQQMPFGDHSYEKCADGSTLGYWTYDIPAIIAEAEKRGAIKATTDIRKRILDYIEKEKDSTLNKGEADALRAVLSVISDTYKESLMK